MEGGAATARDVRVLVIGLSARTGGGGTHLANQVEALARVRGLHVAVWATGAVADRLEETTKAKVEKHPSRGLPRRLLVEQLLGALASRRFDVIYMVGNFALFGSRCPQVLTMQNAWLFSEEIRSFRRERCASGMRARLVAQSVAARASIRRAERVVAVSGTMRNLIESDLGPVEKLTVVPSAAPRRRAAARAAPGGVDGDYVLVVAHDDPHKEWDRLIETFRNDTRLPPLILVGRPRASRHAAEGGRVRMLGQIDDDEALGALYRGASCCLAHSRFESVGITPLEALRAGTPVVATDIPAHREVCGEAARFYDPADLEGMVKAVMATLANPAGAVPAPLAGWTWDDNAASLADVFRGLAQYPRPMPTAEHRRDRERHSPPDPYSAILSDPGKQFGGRAPEEVIAPGQVDVGGLMTRAEQLGVPAQRRQALDFGCGAGSLTRALGHHFESCLGVDTSEEMVRTARRLNADMPNCRFELGDGEGLALVPTGSIDLVFTHLVLQHLPGRGPILRYVAELVRVLSEQGLLVFQLPSHIPLIRRLQPIRMYAVPADVISTHLERLGARLLDADTESTTGGVRSTTYYVTR